MKASNSTTKQNRQYVEFFIRFYALIASACQEIIINTKCGQTPAALMETSYTSLSLQNCINHF